MIFNKIITCKKCKSPSIYIGCEKHKNQYPQAKKDKIFIPDCNDCRLLCESCGYKSNTLPKKDVKIETPKVTIDVFDRLQSGMLSTPEIKFFQSAVENILDIIFSVDMGSQITAEKLNRQFGEDSEIDFNIRPFMEEKDKFTQLLFTKMLSEACGLSDYTPEIMSVKIRKLFGNKSKGEKGA